MQTVKIALKNLLSIKDRLKACWYLSSKLDIDQQCSLTGQSFSLLDYISELTEQPSIAEVDREELEIAVKYFLSENQSFNRRQTNSLFSTVPIVKMLYLIWSKYGVLNPELTTYLLGFYFAQEKHQAEFFAVEFCKYYLDHSINNLLVPKKRFIPFAKESEDGSIRLSIANTECGYEINTPRAINLVINSISDKYIGAI